MSVITVGKRLVVQRARRQGQTWMRSQLLIGSPASRILDAALKNSMHLFSALTVDSGVDSVAEDGEVIWDGHARWCATCHKPHGILHVCPHYSDEIKAELEEAGKRYNKWVHSEEGIQHMRDEGMDDFGVSVMQAFAGPPIDEH